MLCTAEAGRGSPVRNPKNGRDQHRDKNHGQTEHDRPQLRNLHQHFQALRTASAASADIEQASAATAPNSRRLKIPPGSRRESRARVPGRASAGGGDFTLQFRCDIDIRVAAR
jgi:hypothetical protein